MRNCDQADKIWRGPWRSDGVECLHLFWLQKILSGPPRRSGSTIPPCAYYRSLSISPTTAQSLAVSKILTQRVFKSRLTSHLSSNNLLNPHQSQSAYCKHHSTETALCLCLLDISDAFDTIGRSILFSRLSSWFGIYAWHCSRSESNALVLVSLSHISASVVYPKSFSLLFILHRLLPHSTLISSHSVKHHLYADDTQLFLSFRPPNFHSSITYTERFTTNLLNLFPDDC